MDSAVQIRPRLTLKTIAQGMNSFLHPSYELLPIERVTS